MTRSGKGMKTSAALIDKMTPTRIRRRGDDEAKPQLRKTRRGSWTTRRRTRFLDALKATCNVSEAARTVGMGSTGAYDLRRRDPAFAAEWEAALEQGYAELEMLLLRQSLHGTETTETVDDGGESGRRRIKTVHSYPHGTALRLLLAHKTTVDAFRHQQGIARPGSDAVREEIMRRIEALRARIDEEQDEDEI